MMIRRSKYIPTYREKVVGENFLWIILKQPRSRVINEFTNDIICVIRVVPRSSFRPLGMEVFFMKIKI